MFEDILGGLDEIVGPLEDNTIPEEYQKEVINKKLIDYYNEIIEKITEQE